jgi:hypothetical protein
VETWLAICENAACGDAQRRSRGLPTPHAEIAIAAAGVFNALKRGAKWQKFLFGILFGSECVALYKKIVSLQKKDAY